MSSFDEGDLEPPKEIIIGSDEVGLGALAGPLVVVAVAVPSDWKPPEGLNDSKQLSEKQIQRMAGLLCELPSFTQSFSAYEIDRSGVAVCLRAAHEMALRRAVKTVTGAGYRCRVIVDGTIAPSVPGVSVEAMVGADGLVPAVMAASILAKNFRDAIMRNHSTIYHKYGFEKHKGYPTAEHRLALKEHGPSRIHRMSYRPVRKAANAYNKRLAEAKQSV